MRRNSIPDLAKRYYERAIPNMAGRPGRFGLPRFEGQRPAGMMKFSQAQLQAMGTPEAAMELEWREMDRAMRAGVASPPERAAKRKQESLVTPFPAGIAPGFSIVEDQEKGQRVFRILLHGQPIPSETAPRGRYVLTPEKAVELSHKIDPGSGKRLRAKAAKKNPYYDNAIREALIESGVDWSDPTMVREALIALQNPRGRRNRR